MRIGDIIFLGWVHVAPTIVALIAGAWNLCLPKGTALHRKVGLAYVWSMIAASVSSFAIYRFDIAHFAPFQAGPNVFGFFHWLAVAALVLVLAGWYAARHQKRGAFWSYLHPTAMLLSYYDLIGGGINEVFLRVNVLHVIAAAAARPGTPVARSPVIGEVQTAAMAATLLLIVYFAAKTVRYRHRPNAPGSLP